MTITAGRYKAGCYTFMEVPPEMQLSIHCSFTAAATAISKFSVTYSGTSCSVTSSSEKKHNCKRNTALKIYWAFLTQVEVCCALSVNPSAVSSTFPLVSRIHVIFLVIIFILPATVQFFQCLFF